ncbi:mucin-13b, partial [Electrophorus electricus]|uniref:mucin-13b n=1 Tax=Electrophorus electricus TaxID=8005 RepID=UPI0015CFD707
STNPVTNPPSTNPVTNPPTSTNPVTNPPTSTNPVTNPPTSTNPVTNPPSTNPVTNPPTSTNPVTNPPTSTNPVTNPPTSTNPVTNPPTSTNPVTNPPTSTNPVTNPTTAPPVSVEPTGSAPTGTTSAGTPTTTTPTPTSAPAPCASNPCPPDSTCMELVDGFKCICQPGLYYDIQLNSCYQAKGFPSDLHLAKLQYNPEMEKTDSEVFKNISDQIVDALRASLDTENGYLGSTVLKLSAWQRAAGVAADVDTFFSSASSATDESVKTAVQTATESSDGILSGAQAIFKDLCTVEYCDLTTTNCTSKDGQASCHCNVGYVPWKAMSRACVACPSGEKAVNSEICEPCPFGYSGFNCNEPYLLVMIVVSCVLGVLFISALVTVIVDITRKSKKTTHDSNEYGMEVRKISGIPRIPQAIPNTSWQPSNLEETDSGSTSALVNRDSPEKTEMNGYNDYSDMQSYRSQYPRRSAYGAVGLSNVSRANKNPYFHQYEDTIGRY